MEVTVIVICNWPNMTDRPNKANRPNKPNKQLILTFSPFLLPSGRSGGGYL